MSYIVFHPGGIKRWYNDAGDLHRVGGPAVTGSDGREFWYINGKRHREGGPAVIRSDGGEWYLGGRYVDHEVDNFEELWSRLVIEYRVCEVMEL